MRRTKAVQGVAAAAAPFFALGRASSLHALTRSLQAFSTLAAAFAASLAGSTFGGAFGIAHTHARRRLAEGRLGSASSDYGFVSCARGWEMPAAKHSKITSQKVSSKYLVTYSSQK